MIENRLICLKLNQYTFKSKNERRAETDYLIIKTDIYAHNRKFRCNDGET